MRRGGGRTAAGFTRLPALDGLRGFAILLVVVSHVLPKPQVVQIGPLGVTVFFVLSGFLITNVLTRSQREGFRHLPMFFAARVVRLFPALVLMIAVVATIWLIQGRSAALMSRYAVTVLFYVENFFYGLDSNSAVGQTWSLAVEEQFYLVWPFLLTCILPMRRWSRTTIIVSLIVISIVGRVAIGYTRPEWFAYSSLPTNAYALLLGALLALTPAPRWLSSRRVSWVALLLLAAVCVLPPVERFSIIVAPVLGAMISVVLVSGLRAGNRFFESVPMRFCGNVSYSWYLWHVPLLWFTMTLQGPDVLVNFAVAAGALGIATASTYYFEQPLRRVFRRWMVQRRGELTG